MSNSGYVRVALIVTLAVASSGCGGSGTGTPVLAPLAASRLAPGAMVDVSGGYAGTVRDKIYGSGKIEGDLAQYQSAVGGSVILLDISPPNGMTISFILKGRSLTGNAIFGNTAGDLCPTSITATYTSSHTLNGSYKVIKASCSHAAGTFTMKQVCTYGEAMAMDLNARLKRC